MMGAWALRLEPRPGSRPGVISVLVWCEMAEILTDTMGVDFGPYLTRITQIVRQNWYSLMPPSVYPPRLKQGKLAIEFVILKDGKVSVMAVRTSSGDVPLDRAAWGASRHPHHSLRCRWNFPVRSSACALLLLQPLARQS